MHACTQTHACTQAHAHNRMHAHVNSSLLCSSQPSLEGQGQSNQWKQTPQCNKPGLQIQLKAAKPLAQVSC